jgi:hypothetical protein
VSLVSKDLRRTGAAFTQLDRYACAGMLHPAPVHATNLMSVIGQGSSVPHAAASVPPQAWAAPLPVMQHIAAQPRLQAHAMHVRPQAPPASSGEAELAASAAASPVCIGMTRSGSGQGNASMQQSMTGMPCSLGIPVSIPPYALVPPAIPPPQDCSDLPAAHGMYG